MPGRNNSSFISFTFSASRLTAVDRHSAMLSLTSETEICWSLISSLISLFSYRYHHHWEWLTAPSRRTSNCPATKFSTNYVDLEMAIASWCHQKSKSYNNPISCMSIVILKQHRSQLSLIKLQELLRYFSISRCTASRNLNDVARRKTLK
jgi:hypothetical protein